MAETKQLSPDRMQEYFDGFSKRFLHKSSTPVVDVEVLSSELGDQIASEGQRLLGITYEPRTRALEVDLESGGRRTFKPKEVWAIEEDDGFIQALEIVHEDDTKEIVRVRRQSIRRAD